MELRNRLQTKGTKKVGAERGSNQKYNKRHDRRELTRGETASTGAREEGCGPARVKVETT